MMQSDVGRCWAPVMVLVATASGVRKDASWRRRDPPAASRPPSRMTETNQSIPAGELCGVWIDDEGLAHLALATAEGGREEKTDTFRPFAWLGDAAVVQGVAGVEVEPLKGEAPFRWLAHA